MKEVENEPMSFRINRNHFCFSLPDEGLILSNYQLYRTEALEWYPPQLMADLSFRLCIVNNKVSFSIVSKEQKK